MASKATYFVPVGLHDAQTQSPEDTALSVFFMGFLDEVSPTLEPTTIQPTQGTYSFPVAPTRLEAYSSDSADTNGNTVIGVSGLDENYREIQELVTLRGNSCVPLQHSYLRVNRAVVINARLPENTNRGLITLRGLQSGQVLCEIPPEHGASRNAVFTSMADYILKIASVSSHLAYSTQPQKFTSFMPNALFSIRFRSGHPQAHWRKNIFISSTIGREHSNLQFPILLTPKSDVEVRLEKLIAPKTAKFTIAFYIQAWLEPVRN